jgi:hypothetical protein
VCQSEGGTTASHNYDEANRLTDPGIDYDAYGNVTKLPATDAEGHELTSTFYVDNAVASQTQSGVTNEYKLDPEGRTRETVAGAVKTISHYDGTGAAVAWTESPEKWVRDIPGIDGTLTATQTNGETPVLQLHDLQGDVVATIGDKAGGNETALDLQQHRIRRAQRRQSAAEVRLPRCAWGGKLTLFGRDHLRRDLLRASDRTCAAKRSGQRTRPARRLRRRRRLHDAGGTMEHAGRRA